MCLNPTMTVSGRNREDHIEPPRSSVGKNIAAPGMTQRSTHQLADLGRPLPLGQLNHQHCGARPIAFQSPPSAFPCSRNRKAGRGRRRYLRAISGAVEPLPQSAQVLANAAGTEPEQQATRYAL